MHLRTASIIEHVGDTGSLRCHDFQNWETRVPQSIYALAPINSKASSGWAHITSTMNSGDQSTIKSLDLTSLVNLFLQVLDPVAMEKRVSW